MNDHNEWWRSIFHLDGKNNFDPKIAKCHMSNFDGLMKNDVCVTLPS